MRKNSIPLCEKVRSNLIQQDCYVLDFVKPVDVDMKPISEKYFSLEEKLTKNGVEFVQSEYDYPITPEYVNSFLASSDYRRDPLNAVAQSQLNKQVNLGDVSSVQNVLEMDTETLKSAYLDLVSRVQTVENNVVASSLDDLSKKVGDDDESAK